MAVSYTHLVMSHAEDMEISPWDYRLAEDIETVRNCWLSEYYQTKLQDVYKRQPYGAGPRAALDKTLELAAGMGLAKIGRAHV